MKLIDIVKCESAAGLLGWKHPSSQLSAWTQLLVAQGEAAVLLRFDGSTVLYPPGRHTLQSPNLPLLGRLLGLPFGGVTPFPAEVWFCCTGVVPGVKWGTDSPIRLLDSRYPVVLSLRGYGQFSVRVSDPPLFLTSLCRNLSNYGKQQLTADFRGVVNTTVKDCIAEFLAEREGGLLALAGSLRELSGRIEEQLAPEFSRYGLELNDFYLSDVSPVPEELEQLRRQAERQPAAVP
ncbi:MAG: SPFH domain-containing protein [Angelakisella sp.]